MISHEETVKFRRFLEDDVEFRGLEKTAIAILQKEKDRSMKLKKLAKMISKIYRLSEDYESDSDSDSDDSDDDEKWLADSKAVTKKLKKTKNSRL